MFLQLKALFACIAGIVAAVATWLLVDVSGITPALFEYKGDNLVGGQSTGYFIYQLTFAVLFSIMIAAADGVFRDTGAQRRGGYLIAVGCGIAGGLIGPGIGLGFARLLPLGSAGPDGAPGLYLLDVALISVGWTVAGAAAGAAPGIARRSTWIAQRGALGGAFGTLAGAFMFQLTTSIFDTSDMYASAWRLGSVILTGSLAGLGSTLLPGMTRPVWLRSVRKNGKNREYIIGRSPFRIGKDPSCDVVLGDSPSIAPVHMVIEAIPQTNRHRLRHTARSPVGKPMYAPTSLNDEEMTSEKWLTDGDVICVADLVFEFHEALTHVDIPEMPRVQDRPYADDRRWPLGAKTTAIPRSMIPATEPSLAEGLATAAVEPIVHIPAPPVPDVVKPSTGRPRSTTKRHVAEPAPVAFESSPKTANGAAPDLKSIGTRLACIGGPYLGQSFPLSHQAAVIGRDLDHTIALPADVTVSRVHARIAYENGRHILSDFGSQNGLKVNNEPVVNPVALHVGDVISVGATTLRYE